MLDNDLKAQLKGYLERLRRPVVIAASVDDGDKSREMLELLEDIRSQSDLVTVEVRPDDDERKPSFALSSPGNDASLLESGEVDRRLRQRGVGPLKMISGSSWAGLFTGLPYIEAILAGPGGISTDADPEFPDHFDPRFR